MKSIFAIPGNVLRKANNSLDSNMLQAEYLTKAKKCMLKYNQSEKIIIEKNELDFKGDDNERIKTHLNITQLSYAMNLLFGTICKNDYNKRSLAQMISANFETTRVKSPSKNQIYKKLFVADESTKSFTKTLLLNILKEINNH